MLESVNIHSCGVWHLAVGFPIGKLCLFVFVFATYLAVGPPLGQLPLKIFWIWDFCFHLSDDTCNMLNLGTTFYVLIKLWQNKVQDIFATKIEMLILLLRLWIEVQNTLDYWVVLRRNGDEDLAETTFKGAPKMVKTCPQLALLHVQRCCHNFQRLQKVIQMIQGL